jgi:1-acyl-sn-glycerol-3-phosphate acyltransferase
MGAYVSTNCSRFMSEFGYRVGTTLGRGIRFMSLRVHVVRPEAAEREGPYLLACTHLSHLEPFILSTVVRRKLDWMARIEFYTYRIFGALMHWVDAFGVRRFGVPVSAIRTAIDRLQKGQCVAICPEGGVAQGMNSVMRGGPIKRGVCLLSCRTGVPILPCVMLGTDKLNCVRPWIPYKRGTLWIAFGQRLVHPPADEPDRRKARTLMAEALTREFVMLYNELCETHGIADGDVP